MVNPIIPITSPTARIALGVGGPVTGSMPTCGTNASLYAFAGVATLALVVAGCQAPQPAQSHTAGSASAQPPPNQSDCTPTSTDEFCRHMLATERRVENMRTGRDEYNNHNTVLVELAFVTPALLIGLFFGGRYGVRALRKRSLAKAQAAPQPSSPAPDNAHARPKRWRLPWRPAPQATEDTPPSPQPPATSGDMKKPGDK